MPETSFQLVRLAPYAVNRTKRLIRTPKLYWSDPALALWLSGSEAATGAHLETFVLIDLLVWRDDSRVPAPEVLYWRTTTALEVDFVIETGDRLLPTWTSVENSARQSRFVSETFRPMAGSVSLDYPDSSTTSSPEARAAAHCRRSSDTSPEAA